RAPAVRAPVVRVNSVRCRPPARAVRPRGGWEAPAIAQIKGAALFPARAMATVRDRYFLPQSAMRRLSWLDVDALGVPLHLQQRDISWICASHQRNRHFGRKSVAFLRMRCPGN